MGTCRSVFLSGTTLSAEPFFFLMFSSSFSLLSSVLAAATYGGVLANE